MKLRTDRAAFAEAVRSVAVAAGAAPPILAGARIDVAGTTGTVTCSNLDLTIRATVEVTDATDGSVIVPAALLAAFLKATEGEAATLTAEEGGSVFVDAGETRITLASLPVGEWPQLPVAKGKGVELSPAVLADLGRIVGYAYRNPKTPNPLLASVHLSDGIAEATDRYRLARLELGVTTAESVLLPADPLTLILRGAGNRTLTLTTDARRATFTSDDLEWTTTVVEGDYPDLARLIRPQSAYRVELPTARLIEAVKRVSLAIGDDLAQGMYLTVEGGKTSIRNRATERGEIVDVVPSSGELPETICLHGRHLRELLDNVDDEVVVLEVETPRKPVEVRTERLFQLAMPVLEKGGAA